MSSGIKDIYPFKNNHPISNQRVKLQLIQLWKCDLKKQFIHEMCYMDDLWKKKKDLTSTLPENVSDIQLTRMRVSLVPIPVQFSI